MQNRVTPTSEIVAIESRGSFMGNRGCLHEGREIVRPYRGDLWIICLLDFGGRRVPQWAPNRYTPLFFHDEAVALAAGHRPCGECRHADYVSFKEAWARAFGSLPTAQEMNRRLHIDRLDGKGQRRHVEAWDSLPDGTFVWWDDGPALVIGDQLRPWGTSGYEEPAGRPTSGLATVLTPRCTVDVLRAGYTPEVRTI
jgi:hypothetical protein